MALGESCWGHRLIKAQGTSGENRRLGTSYTGRLPRTLESEAADWYVQCRGEKGAAGGLTKRGDVEECQAKRWVLQQHQDGICRNRISSAQARKRRQPQPWRHRGRTACKRVQEVEVKIYWLFSIWIPSLRPIRNIRFFSNFWMYSVIEIILLLCRWVQGGKAPLLPASDGEFAKYSLQLALQVKPNYE